MEIWLRSTLLGTAALTEHVDRRIDWDEASQGEASPYIVLHLISDVAEMKLSGPTGWHDARVQCDCWSIDAAEAKAVARIVATALLGLRIEHDGKKYRITRATAASDRDSSGERTLFRTRLDLFLHYQA